MTKKSYHWEIKSMDETKPFYVSTEKDSVLEAVTEFVETWGEAISVYSVRKTAETTHYEDEFEVAV